MALFTKKTTISTDEKVIEEVLTRSVSAIYPSKDIFKKALMSGRRLRFYIGADATGSQLHIGHATNFMLLEKLRKLGHEIIFLFGDFTAMIGDPTDKNATRVQLSREQVVENIKDWKEQIGRIIDFKNKSNPVRFEKNSAWLAKLNFTDLIKLASHFTVQQMIERDMFEKRLKDNKPIYVHEFFYPLMQGYDSVAMDVDAEVGGNDQTFNMLAGRTLQKIYNSKEKFVITTTLLENPKTGKKLMSKSEGDYIALNDSAAEMFGKTMALPDEAILSVFTDCTYVSMTEIEQIKAELAAGKNPKDVKIRLAKEIVALYHGPVAAKEAAENFEKIFSGGAIPTDAPKVTVSAGEKLVDVLVREKIIDSKSDFRRLIDGRAISYVGGEDISDYNFKLEKSGTIRIGKKRFVTIELK
ncbi:MAG: tyrosine--tRNA ligase [Patescibacteria group bacterium]|nr:tyrosine--tRNA ligase [Patescibacteria group bacterium]